MDDSRTVEMADDEVDAFLGRGGTGVLALADGDVPYAVPVSYGYDPDERCFYLRLGRAEGSEKERFVEPAATARLVVDERTDAGWKSVVAVGDLERLEKGELSPAVVERLSRAELPHFELWDESKRDLEFTIERVDVERLTGRRAAAAE